MKEFHREMHTKIYQLLTTTMITMTIFELLKDARAAFLSVLRCFDADMCNDSPRQYYIKPVRNRRGVYIYVLCKEFICNGVIPTFREWISHVFYVGKGMGNRCFSHLETARDTMHGDDMEGEKAKEIIGSWVSGMGIHIVSGYHCSTHMEGFNREASVIKCIGLENLTNKVRGYHNDGVLGWDQGKIHNYGFLILYTLYQRTINEGLNCIYHNDIKLKRKASQ